jgi:hypothetical protein
MPIEIRCVDPRELRPHPARQIADPQKLARQTAQYGAATQGMPPLIAFLDVVNRLVVYDGVTRATRAIRLAPGTTVPVEVAGRVPMSFEHEPTLESYLP